jgi:hypothetical protein
LSATTRHFHWEPNPSVLRGWNVHALSMELFGLRPESGSTPWHGTVSDFCGIVTLFIHHMLSRSCIFTGERQRTKLLVHAEPLTLMTLMCRAVSDRRLRSGHSGTCARVAQLTVYCQLYVTF